MPPAPDETAATDLLALPLIRRTRELLRRYDLHPVKSLGQNFLVDDNLAHKLVDAALALQPDEVVEIGPGLGALTLPLLQAGVQVIACEKDRKLETPLGELLGGFGNFELVMGDFLDAPAESRVCAASVAGGSVAPSELNPSLAAGIHELPLVASSELPLLGLTAGNAGVVPSAREAAASSPALEATAASPPAREAAPVPLAHEAAVPPSAREAGDSPMPRAEARGLPAPHDPQAPKGRQNAVVALGNLPYYITTPILEKLFAWDPPLTGIVVTMQREVADRILAAPGSKDYGSLTVFCRYHLASVEQVARLGPSVFLPPPTVASTALRMIPRSEPPEGVLSERAFFLGLRAAFGYRRKALRRALATAPELGLTVDQADVALHAAGLDPTRRGETLAFEEFIALGNALHAGDP